MKGRFLLGLKPATIRGRIGTFLFSSIFLGGGLLVFHNTFLSPLQKSVASKEWSSVEGILNSAGVSDDQIQVEYAYEFEGEKFSGDRFSFSEDARNFAHGLMENAISKYRVGEAVTVWVDPDVPSESVLERDLGWTDLFGVAFSLPFLGIGLSGWGFAFLSGWAARKTEEFCASAAEIAERAGAWDIAKALRSLESRRYDDQGLVFLDGHERLIGLTMLGISLFWNGGILVFGFGMVMMFFAGDSTAWFLFFFLIPFVAVGITLIFFAQRKLRGPAPPDFVFLAAPVLPVAAEMGVEFRWVFLADEFHFSDLQEITLAVVRADLSQSWESRKKIAGALEGVPQWTLRPGDPEMRAGNRRVTLVAQEEKSYFFGKFKADFEGAIDLLVRWKGRNLPVRYARFNLGKTVDDG